LGNGKASGNALICLAVALSIVVVSEIRKAVQRHTTLGQSSRPL
jgi:hypothetical protein